MPTFTTQETPFPQGWRLGAVYTISTVGGTPLVVAKDGKALGVVYLKDVVKGGIKERFAELRRIGITTVMITGDDRLTAAMIAAEGIIC